MSEQAPGQIWRTWRMFPLCVSAFGVISILIAGGFVLDARQQELEHNDLGFYHLESAVLARTIVVDTGQLTQYFYANRERAMRETVAVIREQTDHIIEIQQQIGTPDFEASVERVRIRLDGLVRTLNETQAPEQGALSGAIESLVLAAHQLERLHIVEARQAIEDLAAGTRNQLSLVLLAAVLIAAVSFVVARWMVQAIDKQFEREAAALATREVERAHSQRIEALGRLSGGVAHDFNNLLTVILGNVEILRQQLGADSPLHEFAREIEQAGGQAASLARQLLAFSRRDVTEIGHTDLNELVRQAESMLARLLREDIVLLTELDEGLELVHGDPTALHQLVVNLVLNARDALPDGGTVTIETAVCRGRPSDPEISAPNAIQDGRFARLTVRDTGTGIPPEIRERLFDPYFTTKPLGKGTGLGLSTVWAVVENCGGSIVVESEEGVGSQFDVYLPLGRIEETLPRMSMTREAVGGHETILVAEDHSGLRKLTCGMLTEAGYDVLSAGDGAEALALCRERTAPIDLILTDVVMPNMKGFELAEQAKATHPEARILYMTGYPDDDGLLRALRESPERLLQKPFTTAQLLAHVERALSNPQSG